MLRRRLLQNSEAGGGATGGLPDIIQIFLRTSSSSDYWGWNGPNPEYQVQNFNMSENQYFTPPNKAAMIPVPLSGSTWVEPVNKDSSHTGSTVSTDSYVLLQVGVPWSDSYITEGVDIIFRSGSGFSSWNTYINQIEIHVGRDYTVSEYNVLLDSFLVYYYDTLLAQFYIYV